MSRTLDDCKPLHLICYTAAVAGEWLDHLQESHDRLAQFVHGTTTMIPGHGVNGGRKLRTFGNRKFLTLSVRSLLSTRYHRRAKKLSTEAKELAEEYAALSRQALSVGWDIGDKLAKLREILPSEECLRLVNDEMPHGARGVTASRFEGLRKDFPDKSHATQFESVTQARMSASRYKRKYP